MIVVCSLAKLPEAVAEYKPGRVITVMDETCSAPEIPELGAGHHLKCAQAMIPGTQNRCAAPGLEKMISFAALNDWRAPLLIHCQLGVSRSPAAAFIIQCALDPAKSEQLIAQSMRALSMKVQPNFPMVVEADDLLRRGGRMMDAIDAIDNDDSSSHYAELQGPDPLVIPFTPTRADGVTLPA